LQSTYDERNAVLMQDEAELQRVYVDKWTVARSCVISSEAEIRR